LWAVPHIPSIGVGVLDALHVEEVVPPFNHSQVQVVEPSGSGNSGSVGVGFQLAQNVSVLYVVSE